MIEAPPGGFEGPVKRSVTIAGHQTSISLEPAFWQRAGSGGRGAQPAAQRADRGDRRDPDFGGRSRRTWRVRSGPGCWLRRAAKIHVPGEGRIQFGGRGIAMDARNFRHSRLGPAVRRTNGKARRRQVYECELLAIALTMRVTRNSRFPDKKGDQSCRPTPPAARLSRGPLSSPCPVSAHSRAARPSPTTAPIRSPGERHRSERSRRHLCRWRAPASVRRSQAGGAAGRYAEVDRGPVEGRDRADRLGQPAGCAAYRARHHLRRGRGRQSDRRPALHPRLRQPGQHLCRRRPRPRLAEPRSVRDRFGPDHPRVGFDAGRPRQRRRHDQHPVEIARSSIPSARPMPAMAMAITSASPAIVNVKLSDTIAFRIQGMWHDQDVVDRDAIWVEALGLRAERDDRARHADPADRQLLLYGEPRTARQRHPLSLCLLGDDLQRAGRQRLHHTRDRHRHHHRRPDRLLSPAPISTAWSIAISATARPTRRRSGSSMISATSRCATPRASPMPTRPISSCCPTTARAMSSVPPRPIPPPGGGRAWRRSDRRQCLAPRQYPLWLYRKHRQPDRPERHVRHRQRRAQLRGRCRDLLGEDTPRRLRLGERLDDQSALQHRDDLALLLHQPVQPEPQRPLGQLCERHVDGARLRS